MLLKYSYVTHHSTQNFFDWCNGGRNVITVCGVPSQANVFVTYQTNLGTTCFFALRIRLIAQLNRKFSAGSRLSASGAIMFFLLNPLFFGSKGSGFSIEANFILSSTCAVSTAHTISYEPQSPCCERICRTDFWLDIV